MLPLGWPGRSLEKIFATPLQMLYLYNINERKSALASIIQPFQAAPFRVLLHMSMRHITILLMLGAGPSFF